MAANLAVGTLVDTNQVAPLTMAVKSVIHDLTICKLSLLFEDLAWSIGVGDVSVVDIGLTYDTESIFSDPLPESDWLIDFGMLDLGFCVKVENLTGE